MMLPSSVTCLFGLILSFFEQFLEKLCVVNDFYLQAVLAVVVLEGAEAVRALGDDFGDLLFCEEGDILFGHLVKEVFVAEPSGAVAAALLFLAEDPPADAGCVEDGGKGDGDMLLSGVEGAGAADVEEVFGFSGCERS